MWQGFAGKGSLWDISRTTFWGSLRKTTGIQLNLPLWESQKHRKCGVDFGMDSAKGRRNSRLFAVMLRRPNPTHLFSHSGSKGAEKCQSRCRVNGTLAAQVRIGVVPCVLVILEHIKACWLRVKKKSSIKILSTSLSRDGWYWVFT